MREVIVQAWCQRCWLEDETRVAATFSAVVDIGFGPSDVDLCDKHEKEHLPLNRWLYFIEQCPGHMEEEQSGGKPVAPKKEITYTIEERTCRYPNCTAGEDGGRKVARTLNGRNLHETRTHGQQYTAAA